MFSTHKSRPIYLMSPSVYSDQYPSTIDMFNIPIDKSAIRHTHTHTLFYFSFFFHFHLCAEALFVRIEWIIMRIGVLWWLWSMNHDGNFERFDVIAISFHWHTTKPHIWANRVIGWRQSIWLLVFKEWQLFFSFSVAESQHSVDVAISTLFKKKTLCTTLLLPSRSFEWTQKSMQFEWHFYCSVNAI